MGWSDWLVDGCCLFVVVVVVVVTVRFLRSLDSMVFFRTAASSFAY